MDVVCVEVWSSLADKDKVLTNPYYGVPVYVDYEGVKEMGIPMYNDPRDSGSKNIYSTKNESGEKS
jgi:hypothetical protein